MRQGVGNLGDTHQTMRSAVLNPSLHHTGFISYFLNSPTNLGTTSTHGEYSLH